MTTGAGKRAIADVLPKAGGLLDFKQQSKRQPNDLEARLEASARWFVVGMADQILQTLYAALSATHAAMFAKPPKAPKARKRKPVKLTWENLEEESDEEEGEEQQPEPPRRPLPSVASAVCTLVFVALFMSWAVLFVRRHADAVRLVADSTPSPRSCASNLTTSSPSGAHGSCAGVHGGGPNGGSGGRRGRHRAGWADFGLHSRWNRRCAASWSTASHSADSTESSTATAAPATAASGTQTTRTAACAAQAAGSAGNDPRRLLVQSALRQLHARGDETINVRRGGV